MEFAGKHLYFLGIAGIGVSALAQVALARGARVSGADPQADPHDNPAVARLIDAGATLYRVHHNANLAADVDIVIASAAVPAANPEIQTARERKLPVVTRAQFLGMLMDAHDGPKIAVAGTHGKTTTTAMIGVMLQHAGLDPTVFVGGEVAQLGGNVRVGSATGPFVAEACEAYDSFLDLKPEIAVITNIEADHLDHYGTFDGVITGFERFALGVPATGHLVICADDAGIARLTPQLTQSTRLHRYGLAAIAPASVQDAAADSVTILNPEAPADGTDLRLQSLATEIAYWPDTSFCWRHGVKETTTRIRLQVPGLHNIYNALAAATVGSLLGIEAERIAAGLAEFRGATRRQEVLGEIGSGDDSILVMDDYAHHPTEIRATLAALRNAYPRRRLTVVFQPHLYSRTRDFLQEFAAELARADVLIVTGVYAAREQPLPGVHAAEIVEIAMRLRPELNALFLQNPGEIPAALTQSARPGDLLVFMGAGDIRLQGEAFVSRLINKESR